ncbi:MAG TPA: Hsp20/alpha crystallin family protein [Planctomycetota bacterium]|nr:Hsp20/alpha crystallin family protein [Planctomycetota bacterium]
MFGKIVAHKQETPADVQTAATKDAEARMHQNVCAPAVSIHETDQAIIVLADMPGVTQERVEITVANDVLTVRGTVAPDVHAGFQLLRREYEIANFERSFTLPTEIDQADVTASVTRGVVTVTLPKKKSVQPRRIAVTGA